MTKKDPFTLKGYNDSHQPCLEERCEGFVEPTRNVNVGKCNSCGRNYGWVYYWRERKSYDIKDKS